MMVIKGDFAKLYIIVIQLGAISAVVALYWRRFFSLGNFKQTFDFYMKLFVAFIPAVVFGLLLSSLIEKLLGDVLVVAIAMLAGGIVLIFVDRIFKETEESPDQEITYWMALKIGLFQVLALVPGVSRSAATIIGGLTQKLNRKQAAEFSFFLAVPTMLAATAKDVYDYSKDHSFSEGKMSYLAAGCAVAFIVAMIAIKAFIGFLTKHGFNLFGWYRVVVGAIILILLSMGISLSMVK